MTFDLVDGIAIAIVVVSALGGFRRGLVLTAFSLVGLVVGAGTTLVERAQHAGVVRNDTTFTDIVRMVGAIAMVPTEDPEQKKRLLELALDGLRYRPHDA